MTETPNHAYSRPARGEPDWHTPLNQNFTDLDVDIELRDAGEPGANGYAPADGAKYIDTDTGTVYLGDGSSWTDAFSFGDWQVSDSLLEPIDPAVEGIDLTGNSDGTVVASRVESPGGFTLQRSDSRVLDLPTARSTTIQGVDTTGGGTVVAGRENTLDAGVLSGVISGGGAVLSDGQTTDPFGNSVTAHWGTVGGGIGNLAGGDDLYDTRAATVSGGEGNTADDRGSTVGGGISNTASGSNSTISGGSNNAVSGASSVVAGGRNNDAGSSSGNAIGGGQGNETPTASIATVSGGINNLVSGVTTAAVIGGGQANEVSEDRATVGGGEDNTASGSHATVGGGQHNEAAAAYATVGGGGDSDDSRGNTATGQYATVGGGVSNSASADYSTVGGGQSTAASGSNAVAAGGTSNFARGDSTTVCGGENNEAVGAHSTIAGGQNNEAGGQAGLPFAFATVGGGHDNWARGTAATVPGGGENTARGEYSFASGYRANTGSNTGSFVWGDSSDFEVTADTDDQFVIQADGGATIYSNSDTEQDTGVELPAGSGSWTSLSARAAKSNVSPVDPESVLAGVESLSVSTWSYDTNRAVEHMGPMAEQFHAQFGLGGDKSRISNVDADGVALAAIQGLSRKLDEVRAELDGARIELDAKAEYITTLETECEDRDERIDDLENRLAALESQDAGERVSADD